MPLGANKAAIMGVAGVSTADVVLLSTQTASDDASITFTGLMTSTYGEYIFKFYNCNPATDSQSFSFQVNATDGADYNDSAITTSVFYNKHSEADDSTNLAYLTDHDHAQATTYINIITGIGNAADESASGEMHLFDPASTTYVKHFYTNVNMVQGPAAGNSNFFVAGYINDTTAIDDINFKMNSGNFDGLIKMWGVK